MDVKGIKNRFKIDHSEDDELLEELYSSAEFYVLNAISDKAKADDFKDAPIFQQAVYLLTGSWYENRLEETTEQSYSVSRGVLALIQQCRGYYLLRSGNNEN